MTSQQPGQPSDVALERAADMMFALSAPSRLRIVAALRPGSLTVSEIVAAVGMEQSAVSHQLRVLREHQVLSMRRIGRMRRYELADGHIGELLDHALAHAAATTEPPAQRRAAGADMRSAAG